MDTNNEPESAATQPDPVADRSLSGPLLVASLLLLLSLVWALYDELFGERPWKSYQRHFTTAYNAYLKKLGPQQAAADKAARTSEEFQKIDREVQAAEQEIAPKVREIESQLSAIRVRLAAMKSPFQDTRAKIAALTYELDHRDSPNAKTSIRREILEVKKGPFRIADPGVSGAQPAAITFDEMESRFNNLKLQEARLTAQLAQLTAPSRELRQRRSEYLAEHVAGLGPTQIEGLMRANRNLTIEVKQIHVEEAGLVDRCESCHLGVRQPLTLTAADMGGNRAFVSHPDKALLAIHDPERFGCSPCHNGNGLATSSVEKAHGHYEHWLWPLYAKENAEAGCLQCHFGDRVLEIAPTLARGRDVFELRGCVGCHRYEGFDRPTEHLNDVRKEQQSLETEQKDARREADQEVKRGDEAQSNIDAQKHYARAESLRVGASTLDARLEALDHKSKFLMEEQKKVGPNLKDVRLKLRKEWIPVWLKDPPAFRPGTKMPKFRLTDDEIRALAAFVWQAGLDGPAPPAQSPGNAANGKELFETRGCLACHSIGQPPMGGEFAANLTRLGEKARYDYIVRWVHNPRERTRPYCPREKRDLGPDDYAKQGRPFVFDLQNSRCPNDGAQLQVQNMTVMPSLRLSPEDARDIATYLTGLKTDASYPGDVSFMDDPQLAERGRQLVTRYGCGSCHEIRGFEDATRIGTELTKEGSKPIEQLDFGLLESQAERQRWYTHKGFIEHKLENPAIYDQGKEKAAEDRLRMPNIALSKDDIRALTTLLLGSVDAPFFGKFYSIPEAFRYIPTDRRKDIQEGWWLVKKYNCMGCHPVQVGQRSVLSTLPRYQDPDWKEQLPPTLIQEGARVNPEWLTHFLANPAISEKDTNRNGVRRYLKARMPTFSFSPNEIQTLVRFFGAQAGQPSPYVAEQLEPLTEQERGLARALFSSKGAPCLKCHLVGDERHDRFATAPSFLIANERLKPGWTSRWMLDPQVISPGTAMPSGLFRRQAEHWVFAGPTPESFSNYKGDHVQLLVRYMFQMTAEEQKRLLQTLPAVAAAKPNGVAVASK
jgi:mono/diheme cytochrome c family protein